MTRHARIEIVPPRAACDPHETTEDCPVMEVTEEQCLRYLSPSLLPHHLRLVAGNGKVLASSEKYASLTSARRAVDAWEVAVMDAFDARREGIRHVVELDIDGKQVKP